VPEARDKRSTKCLPLGQVYLLIHYFLIFQSNTSNRLKGLKKKLNPNLASKIMNLPENSGHATCVKVALLYFCLNVKEASQGDSTFFRNSCVQETKE
jgi:hypothetical protein